MFSDLLARDTCRTIVHVAKVAGKPEGLLHEVIQRIQVDVREELAGLVPDGQAPAALPGREEIVPGKVVGSRFLEVAAIDDAGRQGENPGVLDLAGQGSLQQGVIDAGEVRLQAW